MNENAICQILGAQLVQRYEKAHFVMLNKPSKHILLSNHSNFKTYQKHKVNTSKLLPIIYLFTSFIH